MKNRKSIKLYKLNFFSMIFNLPIFHVRYRYVTYIKKAAHRPIHVDRFTRVIIRISSSLDHLC